MKKAGVPIGAPAFYTTKKLYSSYRSRLLHS